MLYLNAPNFQRLCASIFLIFTMAFLTSCNSLPAVSTIDKPSDKPFNGRIEGYDGCTQAPTPSVKQTCRSKNGMMQRVGMMGCYRCIVFYDDAGKACQDASDCQGECRTKQSDFFPTDSVDKTGVCAKSNNPFGCYQTIENGVPQPALCVD